MSMKKEMRLTTAVIKELLKKLPKHTIKEKTLSLEYTAFLNDTLSCLLSFVTDTSNKKKRKRREIEEEVEPKKKSRRRSEKVAICHPGCMKVLSSASNLKRHQQSAFACTSHPDYVPVGVIPERIFDILD